MFTSITNITVRVQASAIEWESVPLHMVGSQKNTVLTYWVFSKVLQYNYQKKQGSALIYNASLTYMDYPSNSGRI